MTKTNIKIGDVFSVQIDEGSKKYFQLIAYDVYQLNTDVIRVFKKTYSVELNAEVPEIVKGEVEFYAHCVIKLGIKMSLWKKEGSRDYVGKLEHIIFRGTSDYGHKRGVEPVKISEKWYIWRLGDLQTTRVGRLEGEYRQAEIGLVMTPYDIIERIKTGKYPGFYPDFE